MTRPWGKLHASMLSHRKFIGLAPAARGAWLTLLLYACNSPTDGELGTEGDVVAALRREGFADAEVMLRRLVEVRLVDRRGRRYVLHDWADWQPDDATGAKRKQAWRTRRGGSGRSQDTTTTVTRLSRDIPGTVTGRSRPRREESRREIPLPLTPSPKRQQMPASQWNGRESYDDLLERDDGIDAVAAAQPAAPTASMVPQGSSR